ncbi:hypothetical protein LR48_Vigan10g067000 [Vigna angularis]|uniref:Uncharacterized protein n=1 Tax=Phaseolus angularis TaxID=3914 RepID=A0A0L9VIF8_PHAAN|nr:hypothetical protein LR48_Vigan10g067000 [Vigna angularis]
MGGKPPDDSSRFRTNDAQNRNPISFGLLRSVSLSFAQNAQLRPCLNSGPISVSISSSIVERIAPSTTTLPAHPHDKFALLQ